MSHHMQKKRKVILDWIHRKIRSADVAADDLKKEDINQRALINGVMWEFGSTRSKATELVEFVMEVINVGA